MSRTLTLGETLSRDVTKMSPRKSDIPGPFPNDPSHCDFDPDVWVRSRGTLSRSLTHRETLNRDETEMSPRKSDIPGPFPNDLLGFPFSLRL